MKFIDALRDQKLFGPHFQGNSYRMWKIIAKIISKVKLTSQEAKSFHEISQRTQVPKTLSALCLILGRRSGKSKFAVIIVGEGPEKTNLEKLTADLALENRVRFTGFRSDVLNLIYAANVYVQASYQEGLGTSILDALSLETPTIASRVGGTPEIILDDQCGHLIPAGDHRALLKSIYRFLESPDHARQLAQAGKERILKQFTADSMVDGTLEVYFKLLKQRSPQLQAPKPNR